MTALADLLFESCNIAETPIIYHALWADSRESCRLLKKAFDKNCAFPAGSFPRFAAFRRDSRFCAPFPYVRRFFARLLRAMTALPPLPPCANASFRRGKSFSELFVFLLGLLQIGYNL